MCDQVAKCVRRVREGSLTPARGSRDRGTRTLGVGAGDTCLPGDLLSPGRSPEMQALLVISRCTEVMVLPVSQGSRWPALPCTASSCGEELTTLKELRVVLSVGHW